MFTTQANELHLLQSSFPSVAMLLCDIQPFIACSADKDIPALVRHVTTVHVYKYGSSWQDVAAETLAHSLCYSATVKRLRSGLLGIFQAVFL